MSKYHILALVGMCGSGKSVVCDHILDHYPYQKVYFGGFVLEELEKQGLQRNEVNERHIRSSLREKHGMKAMAVLGEEKIKGLIGTSHVLIDGLYSFSEYKYLKNRFEENLYVMAVFTPKHLRYDRLSKRKIRPLTNEEAQSRDFHEIEQVEKGGPIAIADYTVVNNKTVKDLRADIDGIIKQIGYIENEAS